MEKTVVSYSVAIKLITMQHVDALVGWVVEKLVICASIADYLATCIFDRFRLSYRFTDIINYQKHTVTIRFL